MKKVSLSSLFFLLLLAISLSSCGDGQDATNGKSAVNDVEIPALLPRPVALQNAVEWDKTQSSYMQLSSDLRLKDEYAIEPRITLAQIFANEARVTGEHGHYYPAALKMVNEALEINKGLNPDQEFLALSTKASVQLSQHDFKDALETAKRAIALNPYNAQIYGALIDANVELGNYEDAVAASDKMVKTRPDLRSYSRVSYLREIHGDIPGAIKAMQMAVNAGAPGYESTAWARLTLGELYHRYGEPEKAKKQYQSILVERPKYPFAIAALAELEMDNKNYDEAEKLLDEAAGIIPEVGYYIQLAELYKATGREEEMKTKEEEIFEMLQDDVDSGHNMDLEYAFFYRDHFGDYDKALDYTKKEYEKRPANIDVNRMMASLYLKKGMDSEAASFLEKANATQSKHPELQELLAAR
ncbi:tetratricopeptide repeat protein [Neolewinella aurantiaca]|uniref:Tetratricopeptide repeat protein n=1 Tax=Neolewinella aurantiaca TaxID=2602767 RepID=A0A5C7FPP4_9BACT|nr:tetratricopeptide repeat protein [Neolewinella aurantiaca]TXF88406.1 tetratricopeptide repeat protein [Neolewinella aurantiaca]